MQSLQHIQQKETCYKRRFLKSKNVVFQKKKLGCKKLNICLIYVTHGYFQKTWDIAKYSKILCLQKLQT